MNRNMYCRLLEIAVVGLYISGILFLGSFLFSAKSDEWMLYSGLFCNILAGVFNLVRSFGRK